MNGTLESAPTNPHEPRMAAVPPEAPPAPAPAPGWAKAHDPRAKSPALAGFLSMMPGLGQVYVGYYTRGFVHCIVVATLITFLAQDIESFAPLAGLFLAFFWMYNIVDAVRRAALYNQFLAGQGGIELPDDAGFRFGGSLAGGTLLILIGSVLLLHTRWDIPLDWLEDWWPVAAILLGVYLVGKAVQERKRYRTMPEAEAWIAALGLAPHPEGGHYRETYRATGRIPESALPGRRGSRVHATAIYYLLSAGEVSRLHRLRSDELFHFYAGAPLEIHALDPAGRHEVLRLGPAPARGESFQHRVPAGTWFGAVVAEGGAYSLVGCTVAPGFEFADFEQAERRVLLADYPAHREIIERLTPPPPAR